LKFFYSDRFDLNLPAGHRFPGSKYGKLRAQLLATGILREDQLAASPVASIDELKIAHDPAYIASIEDGTIDPAAMRRIGFPWSPHMAKRARATIGGALAAARSSFETGLSGQLAGGTHHAHSDFGSGYCIYNDLAVVALTMIAEKRARRIAIIDLDVHQGDGNAAILADHNEIFVYSVHGEKNFPFRKIASDLDIPLPDGIEDDAYLDAVEETLPEVFSFHPDLVLYQAGVDPLKQDSLGRMALTHKGLMARDRLVLSECAMRSIPVSMAIGGGYTKPIDPTVEAYVNTYRVAKEIYRF